MSNKRLKGIPVNWNEIKKRRNIMLTDQAWGKLQEMADRYGTSKSEIIEKLSKAIDLESNQ